jgi:hypothetical protein
MSASFLSCNRNKRSIAIDMKSAEGLQIAEKLIATTDVLMHNFRPGAAERVGGGEAAVRAIRRDIIYPWQRQSPQQVAEVVSDQAQPQPHLIGAEAVAGKRMDSKPGLHFAFANRPLSVRA